jgi:membrane protein implicated in regulation of membrane protease activity
VLKVFQVCFATGVLFSVISFLMGRISDFAHVGADAEINADFSADTELDISTPGDSPELSVSPLKPIIVTAFVTVFGGAGMICTINGLSQPAAALIALFSGSVAAFMLYRFIIIPLYRAQNTSAISQKRLRGALARITLPIKGGFFGKISYTVGGKTYSAPARSVDDEDIDMGVPVVIINIEKNTFYVKKIKGGY